MLNCAEWRLQYLEFCWNMFGSSMWFISGFIKWRAEWLKSVKYEQISGKKEHLRIFICREKRAAFKQFLSWAKLNSPLTIKPQLQKQRAEFYQFSDGIRISNK